MCIVIDIVDYSDTEWMSVDRELPIIIVHVYHNGKSILLIRGNQRYANEHHFIIWYYMQMG